MHEEMRETYRFAAAEGKLSGGLTISNELSEFTGHGYVTGFTADGDRVDINVHIPETGHYELHITYAAQHGDKPNTILIDGYSYGHLLFPAAATFQNVYACTVKLEAGEHIVTIQKFYGMIDIDAITFVKTDKPERPMPSFTLTNPKATPEAQQVMDFFASIYGRYIITGQHTSAASGPEIDYIYEVTGHYPAMRGFDLLSYSHATDTDNASQSAIDEIANNRGTIEAAIEWATKRKGLVEICWHWFSPLKGRDKSFYTEHTDFDLKAALEPGTPEYDALLKDLDTIALELGRLRDLNIPVLWRPLHEADGRWFWWGAQGPEPFIKLFRWMHDRYTNHFGLHNLIWIWNAPDPAWNPGLNVVDLVGADIYVERGNYGPLTCGYEHMVRLVEGTKPIALTENGPIPDPDLMLASESPWLWFMPWWGEWCMDPAVTSQAHLRHVYNHPQTITLAELQQFL